MICRRVLARGTLCSGGFAAGRKAMYFNVFSTPYRGSPTLNMSSLMARSSTLTDRLAAQKGESKSGDQALKGRADDESSGADRRAWQPRALCAASGSAQRNYRGAGPDRRVELQRPDGRPKRLTQTTCVPSWTAGKQKPSFPPNATASCTSHTTQKPTNGATSSKTTSARSKSSGA